MHKAMGEWWTDDITTSLAAKGVLLDKPVISPQDRDEISALSQKIRKLTRLRSREHWSQKMHSLAHEARSRDGLSRQSWRALGTLVHGRSSQDFTLALLNERNKLKSFHNKY